ncbi:hypothetical protein D3C78_1009660 [compost metagenome]
MLKKTYFITFERYHNEDGTYAGKGWRAQTVSMMVSAGAMLNTLLTDMEQEFPGETILLTEFKRV